MKRSKLAKLILSAALAVGGCLSTQALAQDKPKVIEVAIPDVSTKLELVQIKGGKYTMVGTGGDPKEVEVKTLLMSKTEVPWDIFDTYAFSLDLDEKAKAADDALPDKAMRSRPSKPYGAPDFGFGHQGYATIAATYKSADKFCGWLSAKTGKKFRLPTEAEWEYAARAGGPAEVEEEALKKIAWFSDNSDDKTQPIGTLAPNAWGLYDMLGNAQEWCVDEKGQPITRGGSWKTKAKSKKYGPLNYAYREAYDKSWQERDPQDPKSTWWLSDGSFVGFRVVTEDTTLAK